MDEEGWKYYYRQGDITARSRPAEGGTDVRGNSSAVMDHNGADVWVAFVLRGAILTPED